MQLPGALFTPSSKNKKETLKKFILFSKKKKILIFWQMELSSLKIKKFLIFSQKKVFLIFWEMKLF